MRKSHSSLKYQSLYSLCSNQQHSERKYSCRAFSNDWKLSDLNFFSWVLCNIRHHHKNPVSSAEQNPMSNADNTDLTRQQDLIFRGWGFALEDQFLIPTWPIWSFADSDHRRRFRQGSEHMFLGFPDTLAISSQTQLYYRFIQRWNPLRYIVHAPYVHAWEENS